MIEGAIPMLRVLAVAGWLMLAGTAPAGAVVVIEARAPLAAPAAPAPAHARPSRPDRMALSPGEMAALCLGLVVITAIAGGARYPRSVTA